MKDILGYEGNYKIKKDGRIWSRPRQYKTGGSKGGWLYIGTNYKGYKNVTLCKGGVCKKFFIHRLVATTYLKNDFNYKEVNHKDGDKSNNHVSNLEWCDRLHNMQHAYRTGLVINKSGEECPRAKLTQKQVNQLRVKYKTGNYTQRELAKEYKINQRAVWGIVNNVSYKDEMYSK